MAVTDSPALRWQWNMEDLQGPRSGSSTRSPNAELLPSPVMDLVEQLGHAFGNMTSNGSAYVQALAPAFEFVGRTLQRVSDTLLGELAQSTTTQLTTPQQRVIHWIKDLTDAGLSDARLAEFFGVTRPTLHSWKTGGRISTAHLQRLLAVREVFERASVQYATPHALLEWLDTPSGFNAITPAQALSAGDIDKARFLAVVTNPEKEFVQPTISQKRPTSQYPYQGAEHDWNRIPPESEVRTDELFGKSNRKIGR